MRLKAITPEQQAQWAIKDAELAEQVALYFTDGSDKNKSLSQILRLTESIRYSVAHRFCRKLVGFYQISCFEDLDCILQTETYRILQRYEAERGPFGPFLKLVLIRRCIDALTAKRKHFQQSGKSVCSIDALNDESEFGFQVEDPNTQEPCETLIEREDAAESLELTSLLLAKISPLERKVLELHYQGHDYDAIGEQVGISWKQVDNALTRARNTTRYLLTAGVAARNKDANINSIKKRTQSVLGDLRYETERKQLLEQRLQDEKKQRQAERCKKYLAVAELLRQGVCCREIENQLGIAMSTVRRALDGGYKYVTTETLALLREAEAAGKEFNQKKWLEFAREVKRRNDNGESCREIGLDLGMKEWKIQETLVKLRKRGAK